MHSLDWVLTPLSHSSASAAVDPMPVQVAVPLSVGTNSAQLHILRPHLSVIDGVKVCVCPVVCTKACEGPCGYMCDWYPLPAGVHVLTLQNLSPGSEYQLAVYSTSHQQTGPPYYTQRIRTGDCSGLKYLKNNNNKNWGYGCVIFRWCFQVWLLLPESERVWSRIPP